MHVFPKCRMCNSSSVWETHVFPNDKWLIHAVKQKLRDAYITNWHAQLDESSGNTTYKIRVAGWGYGPRLLGPKEIDGLLASPGKASTLLCTDSPSD